MSIQSKIIGLIPASETLFKKGITRTAYSKIKILNKIKNLKPYHFYRAFYSHHPHEMGIVFQAIPCANKFYLCYQPIIINQQEKI